MSYGSRCLKWIQAQTPDQTYKESAIICPKPPVTAGQLHRPEFHQKIDPGDKKFLELNLWLLWWQTQRDPSEAAKVATFWHRF